LSRLQSLWYTGRRKLRFAAMCDFGDVYKLNFSRRDGVQ